MTKNEKQQIELKRLMDSPTTPKELKDQLRKRGIEGTLKYYQEENRRQRDIGDIFSTGPSEGHSLDEFYK
ncbi:MULTISPECIES: hypothetical protein [Furfurilactobacillus]|uniref:Uncharacterized protein n=1 Tax=Furfurilactobacillus rossiae TaxID=231049 RepID=A0A7C9ITH6_9LACO|nr:hypothetical protein [Furfurilactobacillus milii]MYV05621.1 hypothetical protein [Furfurilactobacillus milii]